MLARCLRVVALCTGLRLFLYGGGLGLVVCLAEGGIARASDVVGDVTRCVFFCVCKKVNADQYKDKNNNKSR